MIQEQYDDIYKCIFLIENICFSIKFHWNMVLSIQLGNKSTLV